MGQTAAANRALWGSDLLAATTPNSTVLVPSITLPRKNFKKYQPDTCSND
jgi:hypothetical protein